MEYNIKPLQFPINDKTFNTPKYSVYPLKIPILMDKINYLNKTKYNTFTFPKIEKRDIKFDTSPLDIPKIRIQDNKNVRNIEEEYNRYILHNTTPISDLNNKNLQYEYYGFPNNSISYEYYSFPDSSKIHKENLEYKEDYKSIPYEEDQYFDNESFSKYLDENSYIEEESEEFEESSPMKHKKALTTLIVLFTILIFTFFALKSPKIVNTITPIFKRSSTTISQNALNKDKSFDSPETHIVGGDIPSGNYLFTETSPGKMKISIETDGTISNKIEGEAQVNLNLNDKEKITITNGKMEQVDS